MVFCDYKDCSNKNSSCVPRYRLPKNEDMRKIWILNSGNSSSEKLMNGKYIYICADHFEKNELCLNSFRSRVNKDAIPFDFKSTHLRGFPHHKKVFGYWKQKNPKSYNNPLATTSSEASDQKKKNVDIKETPIPTKVTEGENRVNVNEETKSNCSDTEECVTVIQIIEDNEEENENEMEFHVKKDEKDIPTAKRRKFNGQLTYIADALQRVKTHIKKNTKIDEYSIFGELIAQEIRTCNQSNIDITIAQHHIENVIFNLTLGVYNKVRLPALASQDKINTTIPSNINLVIPKSEPE